MREASLEDARQRSEQEGKALDAWADSLGNETLLALSVRISLLYYHGAELQIEIESGTGSFYLGRHSEQHPVTPRGGSVFLLAARLSVQFCIIYETKLYISWNFNYFDLSQLFCTLKSTFTSLFLKIN